MGYKEEQKIDYALLLLEEIRDQNTRLLDLLANWPMASKQIAAIKSEGQAAHQEIAALLKSSRKQEKHGRLRRALGG